MYQARLIPTQTFWLKWKAALRFHNQCRFNISWCVIFLLAVTTIMSFTQQYMMSHKFFYIHGTVLTLVGRAVYCAQRHCTWIMLTQHVILLWDRENYFHTDSGNKGFQNDVLGPFLRGEIKYYRPVLERNTVRLPCNHYFVIWNFCFWLPVWDS